MRERDGEVVDSTQLRLTIQMLVELSSGTSSSGGSGGMISQNGGAAGQ